MNYSDYLSSALSSTLAAGMTIMDIYNSEDFTVDMENQFTTECDYWTS